MNSVLEGKICPYCNRKTEFVDSSEIYGNSYGMIYLCRNCDAYVGVHEGTNKSLGSIANEELRDARKSAHFYFDKIAKTSQINKIWHRYFPNTSNREKAYIWLSKELGIKREYCHIGMFNVNMCNKTIEICKNKIYETNNTISEA